MMEFSKFHLFILLFLSSRVTAQSYLNHDVEHNNMDVAFVPKGGRFASGCIHLGGLEVCQVSNFSKVWATHEGGANNLGATFYEPWPVPNGLFILGSYAQPNNKPLSGSFLVARASQNDPSALKSPVDYTLVWSSESLKIKKDGDGYFWLPIPPSGYSSVGLIITNSNSKPPLEKVRCARSDLVESSEQETWIYGAAKQKNTSGIDVYTLRPTTMGSNINSLGVQVGTFVVQGAGAAMSLSSLKNVNNDLSSMPNRTQIEALMQAYSPKIYFHPEESFFPSSVNWFFSKGALLYQKGQESNPVLIQPNGSNLPQGGTDDEMYWLDLPIDQKGKDEVKKGDLQSSVAYIHVKPVQGATFTDIAIWVFYPFNGAARAKVKLINVKLGKLGEHVGDWEHVTLRVNNFDGKLSRVYFSQHNKGTWIDASNLEFQDGSKFVAYSSLHGHAAYPKPGLVLQGDAKLGIGLRNDAGKSKNMMDTGARYEIISADYLGDVVEPPWLNYARKWGPKISYDFAKELKSLHKFIPGKRNINDLFPVEVLGEDGPVGPKMKVNWSGDEIT